MVETSLRHEVLKGVAAHDATVRLTPAPAAARTSLRAPADSVAALSAALGLALPVKPKTSAEAAGRHALWLSPDEWLLIGPDGTDFVALAAKANVFHSAVDVSHRNVGIIVSGPGAADAINSACPQDLSLSVFPVGACSRTIFGKIEILLYRTDEDTFRVECWRSFSDYCFTMLSEGARDARY